jgi:hypothetical protein
MRIAMGVIPHFRLLSSVSHRMFREKAKKNYLVHIQRSFTGAKNMKQRKLKEKKSSGAPYDQHK